MKVIPIKLPDGDTHPVTLNGQFEAKLPDIVGEIDLAWVRVKGELERAKEAVSALQDYIQFEIDKAELGLLRAEKSDDKAARFGADTWLKRLKGLQAAFPPEEALASVEFLDNLSEELKRIFEIPKQLPEEAMPAIG